MKIQRIFTALCGLLMTAQVVSAQQNMWVVDGNGEANVVKVSSVDFATFHADGSWFSIKNDGINAKTNYSISASCTVSLATGGEVKSLGITPEVGVCYSKENSLPTINDDCKTLGSSFESYSFTLYPLISGTTYYCRPYVKLGNAVCYGEIGEETTLGTKPDDKIINGHKFLDLGLPSGLLWAETNIGAETAADDGNHYAWGETAVKSDYSWDTYKYGTSTSNITKYNSTDGKTFLEIADDAAYVNWGSSCRMPTETEFFELLNSDNCTWTWTSMKNSSGSSVKGCKVTSKKNGNFIFLPASGYYIGVNLYDHDLAGYYWSSTLCMYYDYRAERLFFNSCLSYEYEDYYYRLQHPRYYGYTVRPVAEP